MRRTTSAAARALPDAAALRVRGRFPLRPAGSRWGLPEGAVHGVADHQLLVIRCPLQRLASLRRLDPSQRHCGTGADLGRLLHPEKTALQEDGTERFEGV